MNYSGEAKRQLCEVTETFVLPLLSAIVRTSAILVRNSSGLTINLSVTVGAEDFTVNLIKKVAPEIHAEKQGRAIIVQGDTMSLLSDLGIMKIEKDGTIALESGIPSKITKKDEEKRAYLRGVFLGAGSLSVPAWHLEIGAGDEKYAEALNRMMNKYDLNSHVYKRKDKFIVYLKKRDNICDFMALIGATKVMFDLTEKLAENQIRHSASAKTNFEFSNMQRTIDVGVVQANDIRLIERAKGLSLLNDKLYEVAKMRLTSESLSYDDIAAKLGISKGSVKYRFSKIAEIADRIRREDEKQ